MSFLDLASYSSFCRGVYYCHSGCVISYEKVSDAIYRGVVRGSKDYEVEIDIKHPRKSKCNCPFADGKQTICKHKVALYLAVFPQELKTIEEEQRQYGNCFDGEFCDEWATANKKCNFLLFF